MSKIRFIGSKLEYDVSLKTQVNNRIMCIFSNAEDAQSAPLFEGFVELNEHNGFVQSDYSKHKYIYKQEDDGLTFILTTDENDIYVEPEPIPKPESYVSTLESIKYQQKMLVESGYNQELNNGIDIVLEEETIHLSINNSILAELTSKSIEFHTVSREQIVFNKAFYSIQDMQTIINNVNYFVGYKSVYKENLVDLIEGCENEESVLEIVWGYEIPVDNMTDIYSAYVNGSIVVEDNYVRVVDNTNAITRTEVALVEVYETVLGGM